MQTRADLEAELDHLETLLAVAAPLANAAPLATAPPLAAAPLAAAPSIHRALDALATPDRATRAGLATSQAELARAVVDPTVPPRPGSRRFTSRKRDRS